MEYFCRQPKLYSQFSCTGSSCPDNCCHNWGYILWSNEEYNKLFAADCSEDLHNKIQNSFKRRDNANWQINEGTEHICPFQTADKLCQIQAELGAGYLSSVCQVYPRIFYYKDNFILRTCNSSCNRVMELLINNNDIMELTDKLEQIDNIEKIMGGYPDDKAVNSKYPILKYRIDIFTFLYNIISNKKYSVEAALVLGALATQQISKFEANNQCDKIPKVLEALKSQLNNPEQIKKIESITPNYSLKFNFVNKIIGFMYDCDIGFNSLYENGSPSKEKYDIGTENVSKAFADRPFAFRNIALNILTECFIHFYSPKKSIYDNFAYLIACFACIKFIAVSEYYFGTDKENEFILKSTFTCRRMCHNNENVGNVLSFLKEHNCTSPAHLALLIK